MMISLRPELLYAEALALARLLGCSEFEAEEARRWIVLDGLEVVA